MTRSYPLVSTKVEESGEYVLFATGELQLDCAMHDLTHVFSTIDVKVATPVVRFTETVQEKSSLLCFAETPNKANRLAMTAEPLEKGLADAAESGLLRVDGDPQRFESCLREKFGWDRLAVRSFWAFGPETQGANVLLDDTLPGEVATQLVVLLKRSAGERSPANDVYLETLWTTLLLLYKRSPEQVFVFVLTTMTQYLAVSMELGDASYLALTTRLLSGLAALRAHDRQLLMEYYDKSLIVMLPGRLAIMNADALVAVVRFVQTFFVSNGLASRTPLLTRLGIGMAKQCLALQHRDVAIADKHTCKEVVYSLGYLFLLMAKEVGNGFKKVLVQYSATDQSVVHYCCQQYARRKRRDRFRLRRKKPLVVDSSNFVY